MRKMLVLAGISLLCAGCTYTMPVQTSATNTVLVPNSYKIIGPAAGRSCETHFLGIRLGRAARLQGAIDDALEKAGGNAMIEMTSDYQTGEYLIFDTRCTLVNGLAVSTMGQEGVK